MTCILCITTCKIILIQGKGTCLEHTESKRLICYSYFRRLVLHVVDVGIFADTVTGKDARSQLLNYGCVLNLLA